LHIKAAKIKIGVQTRECEKSINYISMFIFDSLHCKKKNEWKVSFNSKRKL